MNWYKLAQLNKEAFKMNLLFDFYLIASLPKDKILHLLNTDEDFKYYIVKKLDYIKSKYIQDGIRQINKELQHNKKSISGPEELPTAANWFYKNLIGKGERRQIFWSPGYGGKFWGQITSALHDIAVFPDLQDLINQNISNTNLAETIYLLIKKIDYFNDLAHNTGLMLGDMIDDNNTRVQNQYDVRKFLDYKRDYDVRALLPYKNTDPEILRAIQQIESPSITSAKQIMALIDRGYINFPVEVFPAIQQTIIDSNNGMYIYTFAKHMPEADIKKLEEAIIKTGSASYIYFFAKNIKGVDIQSLENALLKTKDYEIIIDFALSIPSADIGNIEDIIAASRDAKYIYGFASYVPRANIRKLENALINAAQINPDNAYYIVQFARNVHHADLEKLWQAIQATGEKKYIRDFKFHCSTKEHDFINREKIATLLNV